MAKILMDKAYFHALRILLNDDPLERQLFGRYYYSMILSSVLCPIRPGSTQWIMMMCWRRARADVFLSAQWFRCGLARWFR
jgi:hypothetical protein